MVIDDTVDGVEATDFGAWNSCSSDTGSAGGNGRFAVFAGAGVMGYFILCCVVGSFNVGTGRMVLRGDLTGNALYDRASVKGKCG